MTEDEEDWEDYCKGGYHPVHIGDTFSDGRYLVVRKLGWGHFSTVWLAKDNKLNRHVALKIVKSAPRYTETALDEIKLLQRLITSATPPVAPTPSNPNPTPSPSQTHPGRSHVISFLDHFRHKGPNGTHVCMVFEVLGENLLGLIKRHQRKGVPPHLVKQIAKQILLGLDYMHRCCGVIHTDLKPENVLICIDDVESIIQSELTASANTTSPPTKLVGVPPSRGRGGNQTPRSESVFITGSQPLPSPSSSHASPMLDKWAFGMSKIDGGAPSTSKSASLVNTGAPASVDDATTAEEKTKRGLSVEMEQASERISQLLREPGFEKTPAPPAKPSGPSLLSQQAPKGQEQPRPDPRRGKLHGWSTTLRTISKHDNTVVPKSFSERDGVQVLISGAWHAWYLFELLAGGDYLFDPQAGARYTKDEDHIAQIIELMGEFPQSLAFSGKYSSRYFNRKGELRHINKLRFWPLEDVLHDKYEFPRETANLIASLLNPMLRLNPEKRVGAGEMIHHRWLDGTLVQGEADVIRRAEEEEARRRAVATNGHVDADKGKLALRDSEQDALLDSSADAQRALSEARLFASYVGKSWAGLAKSSGVFF
ncbi:hypothetical protein EWM64_g1226 [Hericium alpestre]|uniref:non-specific serine/threonine protein kinase n=1 Tax=Hericium alpestre TaxID=135208 RepID=A0A4Z0A6U1_9AGAM|nr:hypothetical protein EWM64_g1226 [Hericium alpestre]